MERKAFYSNAGWVYIPAFKSVRVERGTYTIIVWCPSTNFEDFSAVKVSVVTDIYVVTREVNLS
ncbi:hypothetical protein EYM_06535 [Ignicoccus islandicus DSM 13165]|uniref:Uncharacterized protein n=1 Tax=Ignicoccus islandicus DSM 13165 TaxID=940295 RepID=A0A0U3F9K2_9CREN|nr:hypothetical protein [Ignicoccus islandicus]ALU12696.1 hypothetical protein EYM_06535 [Ignicoccus islandicus DSM 13165]